MRKMKDIRANLPFPIAELLRRLNRRSYSKLHQIVSGKEESPARLAVAIETATNRAVLRGDLRPDLWPDHVSPLTKAS